MLTWARGINGKPTIRDAREGWTPIHQLSTTRHWRDRYGRNGNSEVVSQSEEDWERARRKEDKENGIDYVGPM